MQRWRSDGTFETISRLLWRLRRCSGAKAVQEIAAKRQLHPTQVSAWTWHAIEGIAGVFEVKVKKAENMVGEIKDLHAKVGKLAVENDLSQGLKR